MAKSGYLYSGTPASDVGLYGAYQLFEWTAKASNEPGITDISWTIKCTGKESASSNTKAFTSCIANVYNANGGTIVGGSGLQICNYNSGTGSANYVSYKGTVIASGTFHVRPSTDGTGGFKVNLDVNIGGWDGSGRDRNATFTLDANTPYYYVYIDNGSSFVKAIPYVDNGTTWQAAVAYKDNGTEWKVCN
jgi:hypothetical protein